MIYKKENGHCNVPHSEKHREYKSLAEWCNRIRQRYKGNEGLSLNDAQINKLEAIGFQWSLKASPKSFHEWYEELVIYKKENGHCNVPHSDKYPQYKALAAWYMPIRLG